MTSIYDLNEDCSPGTDTTTQTIVAEHPSTVLIYPDVIQLLRQVSLEARPCAFWRADMKVLWDKLLADFFPPSEGFRVVHSRWQLPEHLSNAWFDSLPQFLVGKPSAIGGGGGGEHILVRVVCLPHAKIVPSYLCKQLQRGYVNERLASRAVGEPVSYLMTAERATVRIWRVSNDSQVAGDSRCKFMLLSDDYGGASGKFWGFLGLWDGILEYLKGKRAPDGELVWWPL